VSVLWEERVPFARNFGLIETHARITPAVRMRAEFSSAAEMPAVATSSRLSCNPPETTLFPYRFFAGPSLTLATSNRHLLGTVYAL